MIETADTKTLNLLPNCDLAGEVPPTKTALEKARERARKYRDTHGLRAITVNVPVDVAEAFDAYLAAKNGKVSRNQFVEKLLRNQIMRKR